jgi:hypothetical protein
MDTNLLYMQQEKGNRTQIANRRQVRQCGKSTCPPIINPTQPQPSQAIRVVMREGRWPRQRFLWPSYRRCGASGPPSSAQTSAVLRRGSRRDSPQMPVSECVQNITHRRRRVHVNMDRNNLSDSKTLTGFRLRRTNPSLWTRPRYRKPFQA